MSHLFAMFVSMMSLLTHGGQTPIAGIHGSAIDKVGNPNPIAGIHGSAIDKVGNPNPIAGIHGSAID